MRKRRYQCERGHRFATEEKFAGMVEYRKTQGQVSAAREVLRRNAEARRALQAKREESETQM